MSKTVDSLAERLTKVEKSLTAVEHQLSLLIEKLSTDHQKFNEIDVMSGKPVYADKHETTEIVRSFLEKNGINRLNPISVEDLHKSMARNGISSEDNEFSRIIK